VSNIDISIDVRDENTIAPELVETGRAVEVLHEESRLLVQSITVESEDGYPMNFVLSGTVMAEEIE